MIEKYDVISWEKAQLDETKRLYKADSCLEKYANLLGVVHIWEDDGGYGFRFEYMEKNKEITTPSGKLKRLHYRFDIFVNQDGAKLSSVRRNPLPFDAANRMAETLCAIRESLSNYKIKQEETH